MTTTHPLIDQLAQIRRRRGLARHVASTLAGLSQATAGRWERGESGPTIAALDTYARTLGYQLALVPLEET